MREKCRENKSSQIDHLMCFQVTLCTLEFQLVDAVRLFCAVRLFDPTHFPKSVPCHIVESFVHEASGKPCLFTSREVTRSWVTSCCPVPGGR